MEEVKVFAPASVANVGPGYDTFGFALEGLGDVLILSKRSDEQMVITHHGAELPTNPKENVASVAIQALLDHLGIQQGFNISITKPFKPGSGLGSSASSSAGAVFAANLLLGEPLERKALLPFVLEGEALASKSYHADNVAPALLGGFNVIRSYEPLDLFQVPVPKGLKVLIIFPDVEVKTAESKKLIPKELSVAQARAQWGNVAGVITALHGNDMDLLKRSVTDFIAEPVRKKLIPGYEEVKEIVMAHGAVGFNISGSGPSMFAFFPDIAGAESCLPEINTLYSQQRLTILTHISGINEKGCEVV